MSEEGKLNTSYGKGGGKKGGKKGHGMKGKNVAGQLRALFAKGVLKRGGSKGRRDGDKPKLTYKPRANVTDAAKTSRRRALGRKGSSNKGSPYGASRGGNLSKGHMKRTVMGGAAAGLRKGADSGAERVAAGIAKHHKRVKPPRQQTLFEQTKK